MTARRQWPTLEACLRPSDRQRLLEVIEGPAGIAAFDADGTLWDGDVGEELLARLADAGKLVAPFGPGAFAQYTARFQLDPADAFAYAGRAMAGLREDYVASEAEALFAERAGGKFFPPMRELAAELKTCGWDIYIVSASNRWSVAPGARILGIDADHVIAVDVVVERGVLTDQVSQPIPTLAGKPRLLRERAGRDADLAFGNSRLDLPLLESSRFPVAVGPRSRSTPLLDEAQRRGWPRLRTELA
jgi:HAD superfamily phosphoserine phosphatase-like hydrolase